MISSIKLFWKEGCIKYPEAKSSFNTLKKEGYNADDINMSTADGLAAGKYYNIFATPTLMVLDEDKKEILSWKGNIPSINEIKDELNKFLPVDSTNNKKDFN